MTWVMTTALLASLPHDSLVARWERLMSEEVVHRVSMVQEVEWPLSGERIVRSVELWFVPPHRFRVCFGRPDSQVVVADGNTVQTYVPDNHQVLVETQTVTGWEETILGDLVRRTPPTVVRDTTWEGQGAVRFLWEEEQAHARYARVEALVPLSCPYPRVVVLEDVAGNVTTYRVIHWRKERLSPKTGDLFKLQVPPGTEVIRLD